MATVQMENSRLMTGDCGRVCMCVWRVYVSIGSVYVCVVWRVYVSMGVCMYMWRVYVCGEDSVSVCGGSV